MDEERTEIKMNDYPVNIQDIMSTAYLQYALSVNVGRAIPDVRDGLKPVNRRILYAMHRLGFTSSHKTEKCAKVVGEVIGNYHPHGDTAVYDALVRLAQWFSMECPLIIGQGNFGNLDGDEAAAYRYTECKMHRMGEEMLADIDKNTVDMIPTFDESKLEPTVLPARFPQLLVNGTQGIGIGMATSIPTHNLGEVIDATVCLLDNPSATVDELLEFMPGPDFPTGAIICGRQAMRQFYRTGHGSVKIRAKADIVEEKGVERIYITEIPYGVNKQAQVDHLKDLVRDKVLTGISDIRDLSNERNGIKIQIDVKKGVMAQIVLNQVLAHSLFETTIGCSMLVVDHNRPRTMNLIQVLDAYIEHRFEVVRRRSEFDLDVARKRVHILEGYKVAIDNLDEVIDIIRHASNKQTAQEALVSRFGITPIQADAILNLQLHRLTGMAVEDVVNETAELRKTIARLEEILADRAVMRSVIREELLDVKQRYATPRKSEIVADAGDLDIADFIPRHSCIITVSDTGYIKRLPTATYRTQHRGGKGVIGMETKEEDHVAQIFNAHSHDIIFFFTSRGFMYWLNVYEIPEGSRTGKGKAIVNLIKIQEDERICAMLTVGKEEMQDPDKYIVMASRNGYIKKSALSLFSNLRRVGLRALVIEDNDDLIGAQIARNGDEVLLSSHLGMACRFDLVDDEIRPMGRTARGVTGMRFKKDGDYVVSLEIISEHVDDEIPADDTDDGADDTDAEPAPEGEAEPMEDVAGTGPEVLVITDGGMGKRSCVSCYRKTHRGARGVVNIRLKENEHVLDVIQVKEDDELLMTTERGQVVRISVGEIRRVGRASQGVRIMSLRSGDIITGVTRLDVPADQPDSSEEGEEGAPVEGAPVDGAPVEGAMPSAEAPVDEPRAESEAQGNDTDN